MPQPRSPIISRRRESQQQKAVTAARVAYLIDRYPSHDSYYEGFPSLPISWETPTASNESPPVSPRSRTRDQMNFQVLQYAYLTSLMAPGAEPGSLINEEAREQLRDIAGAYSRGLDEMRVQDQREQEREQLVEYDVTSVDDEDDQWTAVLAYRSVEASENNSSERQSVDGSEGETEVVVVESPNERVDEEEDGASS
ncbi:hypothetical protein K402DRAFT_402005 [Aulographum hederae CBS 113979]|uniref:Uncharacterized protein n=1 Tax=Aulographum hederae CBS 113979 TaxID=1176131 RepID=A0A6G1H7Z2_9PEZI|nr:hypothetical protein K402DRAFT_402005 [Aulographum hederae CBS 113979]